VDETVPYENKERGSIRPLFLSGGNMEQSIVSMLPGESFLGLKDRAVRVFDVIDVRDTTRADYKNRVGLFINHIKTKGLNNNSLLEFKRDLANRIDISTSTKNKYFTTAKVFLKELNRQGVLPVDITQNIKTFTQSKKHKRDGLNLEEISRLTNKIKGLPVTAHTTRLKAMLSLLIFQGLRQSEIVRLDIKDIDFIGQTAYVQGKGRDDKELVNLHPETIKALREYLDTNKLRDGALFISNSNNSKNNRLSTRTLRGIIKKTLVELGINKTTHGFRHFFTTTLIKTYKGDLLEVAQYTRHRSLEMLQVYNDKVKMDADLPRYYGAFQGVSL